MLWARGEESEPVIDGYTHCGAKLPLPHPEMMQCRDVDLGIRGVSLGIGLGNGVGLSSPAVNIRRKQKLNIWISKG